MHVLGARLRLGAERGEKGRRVLPSKKGGGLNEKKPII